MVARPMRLLPLLLLALCACSPTRLVVPMQAENNSGQSGTATLEETGKGLTVTVVVRPLDEPAAQNLHFHPGQCGEIGGSVAAIRGHGASLTPFDGKTNAGGMLESKSGPFDGLKLEHFEEERWVINVHDPRDPLLYTSCGNLQ